MKKILMTLFLAVSGSIPWACIKPPVMPTLPCSPTPTSIPVLATSTATSTPTVIPVDTSTPTATPGCVFDPVTVPLPLVPPVLTRPTSVPTPDPILSKTYEIRNMADWQAYYGSATPPSPPVDFSTQMLLVIYTHSVCGKLDIASVCSDGARITVDFYDAILCNSVTMGYVTVAVSVPQSDLPVVWNMHMGLAPGN